MASVLIEDLPPATAEFLHRRARRAGASSVTDHVRYELITLANERAPIDNVVELAAEPGSRRLPQPEIDHDATVLSNTYDLPNDVWDIFCIRAAATGVPVSDYVHQELVALSRRGTIDDAMWELGEVQAANPSLDIDFEAALKAMRYARGLD